MLSPLRCVLSLALTAAVAPAQAAAAAATDPYTRGEAAAMARAGYVSFGPFAFGTGHDTQDIEELLGGEPLLWVETAHFRIGCALGPLPMRSADPWGDEWLRRTRAELRRLAARLPRVDEATKQLDPWLRAHLLAMRLEELHAEVMANLGVDDASFPVARPDDVTLPTTYRGAGPQLGMREKFRVLLLRRGASHARYTRAFQDHEIAEPVRDHDAAFGSLYWGGSEEADQGLFRDDLALQAHVAFNVAHNLYSGYRDFSHDLPAWLVTGLGHWHARAVSPRFPIYERAGDQDRRLRSDFWQWQQRVRALARTGAFESVASLSAREQAGSFGLEQHMQSWAVVDWLMQTRKAELMRCVHELKEPFHARTRLPTFAERLERQAAVLRRVFGVDAAGLGEQWRKSVLGP